MNFKNFYMTEGKLSNTAYHISFDKLNKSKLTSFKTIHSQPNMNKPLGGLWLTPNNEWESFQKDLYSNSKYHTHKIDLKNTNKIYNLDSTSSYKKLWKKYPMIGFEYGTGEFKLDKTDSKYDFLDWERISIDYDGIYVDPNKIDSKYGLNVWDIPTILLFNKSLIKDINIVKGE